MVERIKQLIDTLQVSHTQFAETIGINRSNLTHLFSGRNQPSLDLMKKILVAYPQVKTEWLIMGVGEMFTQDSRGSISETTQTVASSVVKSPTPREPITLDLFATQEESSVPVSEFSQTPESFSEPENSASEIQVVEQQPEITEHIPSVTTRKNGAKRSVDNGGESNIRTRREYSPRISHSQSDKKLEKVILFFSDGTFEVYQN
jgi:transcriptional regulator with XRE-family HTH domain